MSINRLVKEIARYLLRLPCRVKLGPVKNGRQFLFFVSIIPPKTLVKKKVIHKVPEQSTVPCKQHYFLFSKYQLSTSFAIGTETALPSPPFSTKIVSTISGFSYGANPVHHA